MLNPEKPDEIGGDLTMGWEMAADGLSYIFALVQNSTFHDGVPQTEADMKRMFDIVRNIPETLSALARRTGGDIRH